MKGRVHMYIYIYMSIYIYIHRHIGLKVSNMGGAPERGLGGFGGFAWREPI